MRSTFFAISLILVSLSARAHSHEGLRSRKRHLAAECNSLNGCICDENRLRQAIQNASTNANRPTIINLCRDSNIVLSSSIDISKKAIEIQCPKRLQVLLSTDCTIDGNGNRIFEGNRANLSVKNIRFTNASSQNDKYRDGGAFRFKRSALKIDSCLFENNRAPNGAGGAIAVTGGQSDITVSTFRKNSAENGGALASANSRVSCTAVDFAQNAARAAGAVIIRGGAGRFDNNMFIKNSAESDYGGAMAIAYAAISLIDSTFSGNQAKTLTSSYDILLARGTSLSCHGQTVFCDGLKGIGKQTGANMDTNCEDAGFVGTRGRGSCPAT